MENKITITPSEIEDTATAFGLLTRCIEKEVNAKHNDSKVDRKTCILFVCIYMLTKELDDSAWQAGVLSCLDAMEEHKVHLGKDKTLEFPEWDPDDTEKKDCYPLCDAFMCLYAWNSAAKDSNNPPENYFGPIFSVGGYVLDGMHCGYHATDDTIKELEKDYLTRIYGKMSKPEEGPAKLFRQLDALALMIEQFRSSPKA